MARNARFWTYYHTGPVKLTLRPGQSLSHGFGYNHDEGYHSECHTWSLSEDGLMVYEEGGSDDKDCDGPLYRTYNSCCPVENLAAQEPYRDMDHAGNLLPADPNYHGVMFPAWERLSASQRDVYAEMMGY